MRFDEVPTRKTTDESTWDLQHARGAVSYVKTPSEWRFIPLYSPWMSSTGGAALEEPAEVPFQVKWLTAGVNGFA
jgi:hypothetical protein